MKTTYIKNRLNTIENGLSKVSIEYIKTADLFHMRDFTMDFIAFASNSIELKTLIKEKVFIVEALIIHLLLDNDLEYSKSEMDFLKTCIDFEDATPDLIIDCIF